MSRVMSCSQAAFSIRLSSPAIMAITRSAKARAFCSSSAPPRRKRLSSCIEYMLPNSSVAVRMTKLGRRGSWLWQAMRPQRRSSTMIEIDSDAPTPMLRKYSMCTGETARLTDSDRSRDWVTASTGGRSGTGVAFTSAMMRNGLRR